MGSLFECKHSVLGQQKRKMLIFKWVINGIYIYKIENRCKKDFDK